MMLTLEQIADFEARAARGEKPKMEWEELNMAYREASVRFGPSKMITALEDSEDNFYVGGFYKYGVLSSLVAAQLAAEHLLREATRPLWEAEIERLKAERNEAACKGRTESLARIRQLEAEVRHGDNLIGDLRRLCGEYRCTIESKAEIIGELRAEVSNLKYAAIQQERSIAGARNAALEEAANELDTLTRYASGALVSSGEARAAILALKSKEKNP